MPTTHTNPAAEETAHTVAIDLGGTHLRAALVSSDGAVIKRVRTATPAGDPAPTILVDLMREMADGAPCRRAVVGLPGMVDHEEEVLLKAPNLPQAWIPFLSDSWLTARSGLAVSLANDADLAAVGEAAFGAGQGFGDVVYVTISTGIGAGIVVGNRLMRGRRSGGEIGHTILSRSALAAGEPATVEELGSGTSIERRAKAAGIAERGAAFADLVRSGHPEAMNVWTKAIESAAMGIVNLCWLVSPEVVVIGGGVGMNGDLVLPVVSRFIAANGPQVGPISVVNAGLGDDAGLVGAAVWWHAVGRLD